MGRIKEKRSAVLCPMIDAVDDLTMAYPSYSGDVQVGGFTWSLFFTWIPVQDSDKNKKPWEFVKYYTCILFYFINVFSLLLISSQLPVFFRLLFVMLSASKLNNERRNVYFLSPRTIEERHFVQNYNWSFMTVFLLV